MDITLKEVEVNKISLKPGDVLVVKMKGEDFDTYHLQGFGENLRQLFPNNKVVVLGMDEGHSIEFEAINKDLANSAVGCNTDLGYCNDCSCGKKEQILSERE